MMATNLLNRLEPSLERESYTFYDRYLQPLPDAVLDDRYLSLRRHLRLAEIAANADLPRWDFPLNNWNGPRYWLRKELLTAEEFRLRGRALPGAPPRTPRPSIRPVRPRWWENVQVERRSCYASTRSSTCETCTSGARFA